MLQPAAEDRSQPAPNIPPEGRQGGCPPLPRAAGLLDCQYHTPPTEEGKRKAQAGRPWPQGGISDAILVGNHRHHENPENGQVGGHQHPGRESRDADMQHTHRGSRRNLLNVELQTNTVPKNQNL